MICILEEAISEINEQICKLENPSGDRTSRSFFSRSEATTGAAAAGGGADTAAVAALGFDPMLLFNLLPRRTSLGEESYDSLIERVRR